MKAHEGRRYETYDPEKDPLLQAVRAYRRERKQEIWIENALLVGCCVIGGLALLTLIGMITQ